MRKFLVALSVALAFGAVMNTFATSTAAERRTTEQAVQDSAALQKSAKELAKIFDVEQPKKEESKQAAQPAQTEKNVAQVLDKAIDKVSDVVGAMAQSINNIAPEVWRIMLKQQYAKAVGNMLPSVGLAIILWILSRSFKKWRQRIIDDKHTSGEHYSWACGFYYVSLILTAIISFVAIVDLRSSIQLLINPEFYAIQDLLRMILNRGM